MVKFKNLLEGLRSPEEAHKVLGDILGNPEAFGSEKILQAFDYISKHFNDPSGACRESTLFYEEDKGETKDIYNIQVHKSFSDPKIIIGAWLHFLGIKPKSSRDFSLDSVNELQERIGVHASPMISVPEDKQISFDREIFEEHTLRLGQHYGHSSLPRDFAMRFKLDEDSDSKDLFYDVGRWSEKNRLHPIERANSFNFTAEYPEDHNYSLAVKLDSDAITFTNFGPDDMVVYAKKDREEDGSFKNYESAQEKK